MKNYQGKAQNIDRVIVGKVTKQKRPFFKRKNYIILCDDNGANLKGYSGAIITSDSISRTYKFPVIYCVKDHGVKNLKNDDIVSLSPDGEINVLWEAESEENIFLLTRQCNCKCVMCPQPPLKDPKGQFEFNIKILNLLDSEKTDNICISGGEPTILGDRFIDFLKICNRKFPESNIFVLTNGTQFSNFNFSKKVAAIGLKKLMVCVALYADTDRLHDEITRLKGSFYKTVRGLHNLAKFHFNIEIRYVINKLNYQRLYSFANFIYRNFPFVVHVAFMGLELTGFAEKNFDKVWIDPIEYGENLRSAVLELNRRDIHTSVYNVPLCLIPKEIWHFSRKSISAWKNNYLPICEKCEVQQMCCGIFSTSVFQSPNIKPVNQIGHKT